MLDWLKAILGDGYTDEIDSKVAAEIGKGFVSRSDFNQVNAAKKKMEDDLKAKNTPRPETSASTAQISAEDLTKRIKELEEQNKTDKANHEKELSNIRTDYAVEKALTAAGAKNVTAAKALLATFLKDVKLAQDGTVEGLTAEIEKLVKGNDTAFLFESKSDNSQQSFTGVKPAASGNQATASSNTKGDKMTYEEACAFLSKNPGAKLGN